MTTRCPAPTRARSGVLCCVSTLKDCTEPSHRRWDPAAPLLQLLWRIRPWWPNRLGRAQDRGQAHVCPTIRPCRACAAGLPIDAGTMPSWPPRLHRAGRTVLAQLHRRHSCGDPTYTEAHP